MPEEYDGSTSDMRRTFFPANDPNYRSEDFTLSSYLTRYCPGGENLTVRQAVGGRFYGEGVVLGGTGPVSIGRNNESGSLHRWWLEGPTLGPGYYVALFTEKNFDAECRDRLYIWGNGLVDVNKYMWICLVSKPPLIAPSQVFNVILGEYCEIPIEMIDRRGERIPESVGVIGSTNPLIAQYDQNYQIYGLEFRYNRRPLGFNLEAQNYSPRDDETGDVPTLLGYPKLEGRHVFRVLAYNMYGTTEETILVKVWKPGVTISYVDWSANWNTFADNTTPYRTVEVFAIKRSSSYSGVYIQILNNTTPTAAGAKFEMTLPVPGTDIPDENKWSSNYIEVYRNERFETQTLVFIRFKAPTNPPSSATEYTARLVVQTVEHGMSSTAEIELKSIVFPAAIQVFGNHLFTAVFPVYCNVATAGQKTINRKYREANTPIGFISVNGADPVEITDDYRPTLTAGWNRLVFIYTNNVGPVAPFVVDDIEGVSSWWSPASMKSCIGKLVKNCIPAVNSNSELENNLKGIFYYNLGAENALNIEQNAFPYMPVNQSEFPFAVVGEGYRQQNNLRQILHYHNNWVTYLNRLRTQALPGYDYLILSPNRNRIEFYNDIRGGTIPTI